MQRSGDIEEYKRKYEAELERWKQELEKAEQEAAKSKVEADRVLKENQHVRCDYLNKHKIKR
jgi:hypothetical protein